MIGAIQQCAKVMTSHLEKYADKKEDFEAKRYIEVSLHDIMSLA